MKRKFISTLHLLPRQEGNPPIFAKMGELSSVISKKHLSINFSFLARAGEISPNFHNLHGEILL